MKTNKIFGFVFLLLGLFLMIYVGVSVVIDVVSQPTNITQALAEFR